MEVLTFPLCVPHTMLGRLLSPLRPLRLLVPVRALSSGSVPAPGGSAPAPSPADLSAALSAHLGPDGRGLGLGWPLPPSRAPLYQASPPSFLVSRYYYLLQAMGTFSGAARLGEASQDLFASLEEQATQNVWWEALRLPRTWITEHSLLVLHVWVLHNRFKVDYNVTPLQYSGRRMQEELFERLWEDTTRRIRNAGVAELSVNKQLEAVQRVTLDDLHAYDAALRTMEEDDGMELAAAVWRGVYREHAQADTEAVLALADYARRETLAVAAQPKEDVYRGWVSWGPAVGESSSDRLARQRRMLEGEWREALDPGGRVFFYHTSTHERRWEPPEQGFYARRRFAVQRYVEEKGEAAALLLPPLGSAEAGAPAPAARLFAATRQK